MDSVTVTRTFEGDLREMVDRCRSLDSRACWPGSVLMAGKGDTLYYQVSMRLKAATMTDIDLEEKLSDVEQTAGGARFTTTQRCSWPDGVAEGSTEYVFTTGTPSSVTFTYRYEPPSTKLVKSKQLPAFHEGMEKVATRYLDRLTQAPVNA
ncbi:MAG: hypothetical protein JWM40_1037 [Frankiales bacterium]|nr:hypothetical protein [Frankiales bacterium]